MFNVIVRIEPPRNFYGCGNLGKIIFLYKDEGGFRLLADKVLVSLFGKKITTGKEMFFLLLNKLIALFRNTRKKIGRESFRSLAVYENEKELPEKIKNEIRILKNPFPMEIEEAGESAIYIVLINCDSTEGRGPCYIWFATTNRELAYKLSLGNGPSGGDSEIEIISLNKKLETEIFFEV